MATSVTLPALGESVTEGTVTRWLKQEGDTVEADEPLLEVSTDKVDTEIPSPAAGTLLSIKVQEDETVEVGAELALIGDAADGGAGDDSGAGDDGGAQAGGSDGGGADGGGANDDAPDAPAHAAAEPDGATTPATDDVTPATVAYQGSDEGARGAASDADSPEATAGEATMAVPGAATTDSGSASDADASASVDNAGAGGGDRVSVTLPALGESVTEGTVTRWLKQEGDPVEADEPLLEVSTDKVDTEIPSPAAGTLISIKVQEDETVDVGTELAVIGNASEPTGTGAQPAADDGTAGGATGDESGVATDEQPAAVEEKAMAEKQEADAEATDSTTPPNDSGQQTQPAAPPPAPKAAPSAAPEGGQSPPKAAAGSDGAGSSGDGAYVTPLVRKLAAEAGLDLGSITGTGVGGRIRKQDVTAAVEAKRTAEQAAQAPAAAPAAAASPSTTSTDAATSDAGVQSLRGQTVKMTRMRAFIAKRMVESLQVSAQLTTVVEVDVTQIARLRSQAKTAFESREGVKLSFLPFFAKAAIEALRAYPQVNSTINAETNEVSYHAAEHLGVAVDTERGLIVPVIHNAGDLNIGGLARKIADLAERTRTNKIAPDELSGGTFTLTNTGSRGALFDTPIINQPQVGILGTGAVVKRPVVIDDPRLGETIVVRSMVYLALTYDHRIVDGADAARFLTTMKSRLEEGHFESEIGL